MQVILHFLIQAFAGKVAIFFVIVFVMMPNMWSWLLEEGHLHCWYHIVWLCLA